MWASCRGRWRSVGTVLVLTVVFLVVNTHVVFAASNGGGSGGLLGPLNIDSSEGVPVEGYELKAEGGSILSFKTQTLALVLGGLFALVRLAAGLAGWAVEVAYRFPLLKILSAPAQTVSTAYRDVVVDGLGLEGVLLAWAFVFGLLMFVRGKVGKGLGEVALTLLITGFAASAFVRPDYLLAHDGPLGQSQQVAAEVAQRTVASYNWGGKVAGDETCDAIAGPAKQSCEKASASPAVAARAGEVAKPLQDSLTNALVVKPYMMLQYGRVLDPSKPSDRKAYSAHLKWVSGGYAQPEEGKPDKDPCRFVKGPLRGYCEGDRDGLKLPALTPGGQLLESLDKTIVSEEDQQFAAFLKDLEEAGPVGKSCASYAKEPTWSRVGGGLLLVFAALVICGVLLGAAMVLLVIQAVAAGAAAVGSVAFVAGMLPGPSRQVVWKWLSLWGVAVVAVVAISAFIPFFGIAMDAVLTDGPELLVERLLLLDVLALAGAFAHRRMLAAVTGFGRRAALRMRSAKVGGTHLPGDTGEFGAAMAAYSQQGGGLRALSAGGGGRLGTRGVLMGSLAALGDGSGMPVEPGRVLSEAGAEVRRGLAPLALAGAGAAKGAYHLLVGKAPDEDKLQSLRKPLADVDSDDGEAGAAAGGGRLTPGGPGDRHRDAGGVIVDHRTGEVLHDQHTDRTLLSTRAHNRLVRLRGYRVAHTAGRVAFASTLGLPTTARSARTTASQTQTDAAQQVRVWSNTVREDARSWGAAGERVRSSARLSRPAAVREPVGPAPAATAAASGASSRPVAPEEGPRSRPGPVDSARLRRRVIEQLGGGDPQTRQRLLDEMESGRRPGDGGPS